jgi:hypothetical protein
MKKTILVLAGVASILAVVPAAQAAALVAGNFNVSVTLISQCTIASAIGNLSFGTYTAFQGGDQPATPVTTTLSCTRGLLDAGVKAAFDTVDGDSTAAAAATTAEGAGVLAGLQYGITATPGTITTGTAATASTIGVPASRAFTISGTMPAGQAGDFTALSSRQRTLTISY